MINLQFFVGAPAEFQNVCLVYPPKIKEVVSNSKFGAYTHLLTLTQEEIEDDCVKRGEDINYMLNPFEYLLNVSYRNEVMKELVEGAFFFFTHEPIITLYEDKKIIIGELKDKASLTNLRYISEENYFGFQNMIRDAIGAKIVEPPNPNENPRIKAMKAKARLRDKIKAKQGGNLSLESTLSSICCMGIGLNPLNIGELSYACLPILVPRYQAKEKFDLDTRSLMAGADRKKVKPKYWISNLNE